MREELERAAASTYRMPIERRPVKAAFEVHIEQGPVLEQSAKSVGVVTGVQHMSRHEVVVTGQEAHAGPTPMDMRRDPVRVLADVLPACYAAAAKRRPHARLTVAVIETRPSSPNTVPGFLRFFLDLRHPETVAIPLAARGGRGRGAGGARAPWPAGPHSLRLAGRGRRVRSRCAWPPCGRRHRAFGCKAIDMVSGAGHDSVNVARVVPTAMIFVPCAGGLSHNEAESASAADLETGANVLMHAMLTVAKRQALSRSPGGDVPVSRAYRPEAARVRAFSAKSSSRVFKSVMSVLNLTVADP